MQILNFTEPLIKPALQDRSKCFTIRKAWDKFDINKMFWNREISSIERDELEKRRIGYTNFFEQQECRHKVGALETIMWNQRAKNGLCCNCVRFDAQNRCVNDAYARLDPVKYALRLKPETKCLDNLSAEGFSKVFGVGKIVQTPKVWMDTVKEEDGIRTLIVSDMMKEPLEVITEHGTFFNRYGHAPSVSQQDGFKNPVEFKNFFLRKYPILLKEQMPFWRIRWDWQKY